MRLPPPACASKLSDGKIHLFPYGQLVTASLVRTEDSEIVRIIFATHDVEITGRNLRELLHALQDFAVKWVRAIPQRYQLLGNPEAGMVSDIRIIVAE